MGATNLDHAETKSVSMQRGARFAFSGSAPIQRGARFLICDVLLGGPTWPSEGVRSIYKPNGFLNILEKTKNDDVPEVDAKD